MRPLLLLAFAVMVVFLGAMCSSADKIEQSPLATWDPSASEGFPGAATRPGTLDVAADCVRLIIVESESTILLVWPEPTSWNASSQAIEFVGVKGERVELRHSDRIMLGAIELVRDDFEFVLPPNPSYKADTIFIVNSLVPMTG